jgi:hypothetical protein
MENLLSPEELAQILGVKPQTLARWRVNKNGPPYSKLGKIIRYNKVDLIDWLNKHKYQSTRYL